MKSLTYEKELEHRVEELEIRCESLEKMNDQLIKELDSKDCEIDSIVFNLFLELKDMALKLCDITKNYKDNNTQEIALHIKRMEKSLSSLYEASKE